jgi:hypothetical protein
VSSRPEPHLLDRLCTDSFDQWLQVREVVLSKAARADSLLSAASIKQRRGGSCRLMAKAVSNNRSGHSPQMIYQQRTFVVPLAGLIGNCFLF